jgi:hypothetical protein
VCSRRLSVSMPVSLALALSSVAAMYSIFGFAIERLDALCVALEAGFGVCLLRVGVLVCVGAGVRGDVESAFVRW